MSEKIRRPGSYPGSLSNKMHTLMHTIVISVSILFLAQTTHAQQNPVYLGSPDSRYTISIGDQVCTECTMRVERIGDDLYIIIAPLHGEEIKYAIPEESSFCVSYYTHKYGINSEETITGVGLQVINNQEGNKTLPNHIRVGDELVLPEVRAFKNTIEAIYNK